MRKYRFFYHYNKIAKKMTVHFRGECILADKLICEAKAESKRNKRQPYLVMQGFARCITNHIEGYSNVVTIV